MGDRAGLALSLGQQLVHAEPMLKRRTRHPPLVAAAAYATSFPSPLATLEHIMQSLTVGGGAGDQEQCTVEVVLLLESMYPAINPVAGAWAEWQSALASLKTHLIVRCHRSFIGSCFGSRYDGGARVLLVATLCTPTHFSEGSQPHSVATFNSLPFIT
jgi:hypothetical protein